MDLPRSQTMMSAYAAIYEADQRTPQQRQAAENEYDAYEAETGGDISMDEWKKSKLKKKNVKEDIEDLGEGAPSPEEVARRKKQQEFEKKMSRQKDSAVEANKRMDDMEEQQSYTSAYLEGYKPMDQNKMQDKAAMKPDTAKGEKQARKIDKVRAVAKHAGPEQEEGARLQNKLNKVNPLKRAFKKPAFDKSKNKALGLEQKRRADLDKRYGPKKEEVAQYLFDNGYALSEESAEVLALHISDEFLKSLVEDDKGFFLSKIENLEEKEGKKDACYHKVKSRYDVWPSAYASGALVKCRNKGAKNWGNSSKKKS